MNFRQHHAAILNCRACGLRANCAKGSPTAFGDWSQGKPLNPALPRVMIVTDHPDLEDQFTGAVLTGSVWNEFNRHFGQFLSPNAYPINLFKTSLTRCPPDIEKKKRILPSEIESCSHFLIEQIQHFNPHIILALGQDASQWLIGSNFDDMDSSNGRYHPLETAAFFNPALVVPIMHPKIGMGMSSKAVIVMDSIKYAAEFIKLCYKAPDIAVDKLIKLYHKQHKETNDPNNLHYTLTRPQATQHGLKTPPFDLDARPLIALDTETLIDGSPYCLSASLAAATAVVIPKGAKLPLAHLRSLFVGGPANASTAIMHNGLFDIPILHRMGFHTPGNPARPLFGSDPDQAPWFDTMIMADILQNEPRGLKALTRKHTGLNMQSFEDTIGEFKADTALLEYITLISQTKFPNPAPKPEKEWDKTIPGEKYKYRQPRNIQKAAAAILKVYAQPRVTKATLEGEDPPTLANLWLKIPKDEGRDQAEALLGPPPLPDVSQIPKDKLTSYAAKDADATLRVFHILKGRIINSGLSHIFDLDTKASYLVQKMLHWGMAIDKPRLIELELTLSKEAADIRDSLAKLTGIRFNPESTQQCAFVLYTRLSMPAQSSGNKEISTDDKALTKLQSYYIRLNPNRTNTRYNLNLDTVALLQDHREIDQLLTAFIRPLIAIGSRSPDGRIRADLKVCGTETGRMTSSKPNLLAIPAHTARGKLVKAAFIAEPGFTMVNADYSQLELRILAAVSQDPTLLRAYTEGLDIHATTAATIYNCHISEVTKDQRNKGKTINFGIIYGLAASGLSEQLRITKPEAQHMIDSYFKTYPRVRSFMDETLAKFTKQNSSRDLFGRVRWLPNLNSTIFRLRMDAQRQAFNALIQSSASGITKSAMRDILPHCGDSVRPLLQIHDALLFSVRADLVESFSKTLKHVMESAYTLPHGIPLVVDVGSGPNWADMEK